MNERKPPSVRVVCMYCSGRVIALKMRLRARMTETERQRESEKIPAKKKFPRNYWSCVRTTKITRFIFHGQINLNE